MAESIPSPTAPEISEQVERAIRDSRQHMERHMELERQHAELLAQSQANIAELLALIECRR